jgi:SAM-dependent methyltransferase
VKQKDIFLESEGNAWLERNRAKLGERDPVSDAIESVQLNPKSILEVGCANGWRLAKLRDRYGCEVTGIEPSLRACIEAADLKVPVIHGSASMLPFAPEKFDVIVFGFCLYMADTSDWLRIAAEADTVLRDDGHIIIHDWGDFKKPYSVIYEHDHRMVSWHFDFANLWLAHPQYSLNHRFRKHRFLPSSDDDSDLECVTFLRKNRKFEITA